MIEIPIDDPDDPRLSAYRDIRERDLVGRQGRFIAEGKVVVEALVTGGRFGIESALVLEGRLAGMQDILARARPDLPVYVVTRAVIDAVAGFPMHRGILAIGVREDSTDIATLLGGLPERALVVALCGIANHDNVGAIFRNSAAFGVDAVLLDATSCDPLYRKAIRVSTGSALKVPFAIAPTGDAMIDALSAAGFTTLALTPSGSTTIADTPRTERMALLLGSEGEGLPVALMQRLTTVRIPMAQGFDSLNVATAAAIALHEMRRSETY